MYNLKHNGDYQIYRDPTGLKSPGSPYKQALLNKGVMTGLTYKQIKNLVEFKNVSTEWFYWFEPILEEVNADV